MTGTQALKRINHLAYFQFKEVGLFDSLDPTQITGWIVEVEDDVQGLRVNRDVLYFTYGSQINEANLKGKRVKNQYAVNHTAKTVQVV